MGCVLIFSNGLTLLGQTNLIDSHIVTMDNSKLGTRFCNDIAVFSEWISTREEILQSDGGMADYGVRSLHIGGSGAADGTGCHDVKLGGEAAADTSKR